MEIIITLTRFILAVIFGIAGMMKMLDRPGTQQALKDFGVPSFLAHPLGFALPIVELMVASAILTKFTAWQGALFAFLLLSIFVAGIGINLFRGKRPKCNCFGQLSSTPVGWSTLVRNLVLALAALLIVLNGKENVGVGVFELFENLTPFQIVGLTGGFIFVVLLIVEGWFIYHLLLQQSRLFARIESLESISNIGIGQAERPWNDWSTNEYHGLAIGEPASDFQLTNLEGETSTLTAYLSFGKPVILFFIDPECSPCSELMPEISYWQNGKDLQATMVIISRGEVEINRKKSVKHLLRPVLLQKHYEVEEAYQVQAFPSAVLVESNGMIGSDLAVGIDKIRSLVTQFIEVPDRSISKSQEYGFDHHSHLQSEALTTIKLGHPAPEIRLPDLDGNIIDLTDFKDTPISILFWNPNCGYCKEMLPNIKAWEMNKPKSAPELLVISSGATDSNLEMQLNSLVVLDQEFKVGRAYGVTGTPMAILIDAGRNIASEIIVGGNSIMKFLNFEYEYSYNKK